MLFPSTTPHHSLAITQSRALLYQYLQWQRWNSSRDDRNTLMQQTNTNNEVTDKTDRSEQTWYRDMMKDKHNGKMDKTDRWTDMFLWHDDHTHSMHTHTKGNRCTKEWRYKITIWVKVAISQSGIENQPQHRKIQKCFWIAIIVRGRMVQWLLKCMIQSLKWCFCALTEGRVC